MAMQTASLGTPSDVPADLPADLPADMPIRKRDHAQPPASPALLRWASAGLICVFSLLAMTTASLAQNQQPNQAPDQDLITNTPQQRLEPTGEVFGDWRLICSVQTDPAATAPPQACFISERIVDPNSQRTVLIVTIGFFRAGGQPGALISMPLGIPLSTGVQISVDGRPVSTVPFEVCRRDGCQAFVQLDETVVNAFRAGNKAAATVRTGERGAFSVPFSLKGFTAGYGRIK